MSKPIRELTRSELDRALAQAHKRSMELVDAMIAAGRGHERPSDTRGKADELSQRVNAAADSEQALRAEAARRMAWHGSHHRIK